MEAMLATGAVEAVAIADPSRETAAEAQRLAPEAKLVPTLGELLDMGVDGVVIATPSALHAEQAILSLAAGAAVFCQKPLGRNEAEVRTVVEAARKADRLLGVDLSYRAADGVRQMRKLIQTGALGRIYAADLVFHNAYGPDKSWFYERDLSGGGCVMDLGVHLVDLALWTLGFPKVSELSARLFARGEPLRPGEVEDYALATLGLEDGAAVQLTCSWRLPAGCDALITASFFGTEGGIALRNLNGSFYDFEVRRFRGTASEPLGFSKGQWGGRAAGEWARRLAGEARFDAEAERFADVARVLDLIYGRPPAP
jgi:predicted dehydrogenase